MASILILQVPRVININFLLLVHSCNQDTGLQKLIKSSLKGKSYDPKSNCLNKFFKEMYQDQCGEF